MHENACAKTDAETISQLAPRVYRTVCRTDLTEPGYCVLDLGPDTDSKALRRSMVKLTRSLVEIDRQSCDRQLSPLWARRFNQQTTAKPHIDGGPPENLLVLGYEATPIESVLSIYDYSRCASDRSLSPREFLDRFNPMYRSGLELLQDYESTIACVGHATNFILCLNNSCPQEEHDVWLGVLHGAVVSDPDPTKRRTINSMMLGRDVLDGLNERELLDFQQRDELNR